MKLIISNFQSIKQVSLDMNGFVALTGNSDIGKSAVVRAVKFVFDNDYNKTYMRHGTKKMEITVDNIHRVKSASINSYEVNGRKYDKVGMGIPDVMAERGYAPFVYNGGSDNTLVVPQYKPLFLVNETEYVQTKMFQSLFGTDLYEEAIRLINKDILATNREISYDENRKSDLNLDISTISSKLTKLTDIQKLVHNIHNLREYKEQTILHEEKTVQSAKLKTQGHRISEIMSNLTFVYNLRFFNNEYTSLSSLTLKKHNMTKAQGSISKIIDSCSNILNLSEAKEAQRSISEDTIKKDGLWVKSSRFSTILLKLDKCEKLLVYKKELENVKTDLHDNTQSLNKNTIKLGIVNKLSATYKQTYLLMGYNLVEHIINQRGMNLAKKLTELEILNDNSIEECPCCGQLIGADHA